MSRERNAWLFPVSVLVALLLGLLPLPAWLQPFRPYWLALVIAYWLIEAPERVGLGIAFAAGLAADLAFGGLLGEQALRLTVLAFIVQRFRSQLRFFPIPQAYLGIAFTWSVPAVSIVMSRSVCASSIATRSIDPIVPPASPIAVATRPSIPGRWSIRTRRTNENWADVGSGTGAADLSRATRAPGRPATGAGG